MSKFNTAEKPRVTTNLAGGKAYRLSERLELAALALASFVEGQYYRSASAQKGKLELYAKRDPGFASKVALYARHEFGMRSSSHVIAAAVAGQADRQFYNQIVKRPDDILEILALIGRPIPNQVKRGFADALGRFDAYRLAKYKGVGKKYNLYDAINLCHPQHTGPIGDFMAGRASSADTWEVALSTKGASEWTRLVEEDRLGYFAMLRNLRGLLQSAPESLEIVAGRLTAPDRIRKSKVFPYRFLAAYKELQNEAGAQKIIPALKKAARVAVENVPPISGSTLVAIDTSGSMRGAMSTRSKMMRIEVATMMGLAIAGRSQADLVEWADSTRPIGYDPNASPLEHLPTGGVGIGTNMASVFDWALALDRKYDTIVFLTDLQSWHQSTGPSVRAYGARYGRPRVVTIDLAGYGTSQFADDYYHIAGYSDKIFDLLDLVSKNQLIETIENYTPGLPA